MRVTSLCPENELEVVDFNRVVRSLGADHPVVSCAMRTGFRRHTAGDIIACYCGECGGGSYVVTSVAPDGWWIRFKHLGVLNGLICWITGSAITVNGFGIKATKRKRFNVSLPRFA
jgi:hypothetical protein